MLGDPLREQGAAVRDRSLPEDQMRPRGRRLGRIARRRLGNPDAGLDMKRPSGKPFADLLEVGQTVQVDVVLPEAAIGDRRGNDIESRGLTSLVELKVQIGIPLEVRPRDEVEALAFPRSGKVLKRAQILSDRFIFEGESNGRYSLAMQGVAPPFEVSGSSAHPCFWDTRIVDTHRRLVN